MQIAMHQFWRQTAEHCTSIMHQLLIILVLSVGTVCSEILYKDACDVYWKCSEDITRLTEACDVIHQRDGTDRPWYAGQPTTLLLSDEDVLCGLEVEPEIKVLRKVEKNVKRQFAACLQNGVAPSEKIPAELERLCEVFMSPLGESPLPAKTTKECWLRVKRASTRCSQLAKCCPNSAKCEGEQRHSNEGKKARALRDELVLRIADCKENANKADSAPIDSAQDEDEDQEVVDYDFESENRTITKMPPTAPPTFESRLRASIGQVNEKKVLNEMRSLCDRYLLCEEQLAAFRHECHALSGVPRGGADYSWSLAYAAMRSPLDDADAACRQQYAHEADDVLLKQEKAHSYLRGCTRQVNVTKEIVQKPELLSGCTPSLLTNAQSSAPVDSTCREQIAVRKAQCAYLKQCCPHADVCERTPLYALLADDYLLSVFSLRDKMNECYSSKLAVKQRRT